MSKGVQAGEKEYFRQMRMGGGRALMTTRLLPSWWTILEVEVHAATSEIVSITIRPAAIDEGYSTSPPPDGDSGAGGHDAPRTGPDDGDGGTVREGEEDLDVGGATRDG